MYCKQKAEKREVLERRGATYRLPAVLCDQKHAQTLDKSLCPREYGSKIIRASHAIKHNASTANNAISKIFLAGMLTLAIAC